MLTNRRQGSGQARIFVVRDEIVNIYIAQPIAIRHAKCLAPINIFSNPF